MKTNFRNFIDVTPFDKDGHSFWGLKRHQAKWIATGIILLSILLMSPPGMPDPTDVINIFMAHWLVNFVGLTQSMALLLSYTIIPWTLFLVGLYIYPHNTESLLNGYINKLKKLINKYLKNPIVVIALILIGKFVFDWYASLI